MSQATKILKVILLLFFLLIIPSGLTYAKTVDLFGAGTQKTYKESAKIDKFVSGDYGITAFGFYSIPAGDVANIFNSSIGVEISFIYRNFLKSPLPLDAFLNAEYVNYPGKAFAADSFTLISPKLGAKYNFVLKDIPGELCATLAGGVAFENTTVAGNSNSNMDPVFEFGVGYELSIFKGFTFRCGATYEWIMQKYISGASRDGNFIRISAGINMVLVTKKQEGDL